MLEAGVDPDTPDRSGWTSLHFAAQEQHAEVARLLLDAGASVDAQDVYGKSPLSVALFNVRDREGDVIRLLLAVGASPDLENASGVSLRDLAERVSNCDLMRFLR